MPEARERTFARQHSAVVAARVFVAEVMTEAGFGERVEDVRLCTAELTTNAIMHGSPPGSDVLVRVVIDGTLLRVEVHDAGSGMPCLCTASEDELNGRGLFLVNELANSWGVTERAEPGKAVWAEFKLTIDPVALTC